MPFHEDEEFITKSHTLLEDNVANVDLLTRITAGEGLANFLLEYFYNHPVRHNEIKKFLEIFCKNLTNSIMITRQGYAYALGNNFVD
jgi:hypothetical protein